MIHIWELHFNIHVLPFKARRLLSWRLPPPAGQQPNSSSRPSGRWNSASLMFLSARQLQQQQAAALSITSITHNAPAAEPNLSACCSGEPAGRRHWPKASGQPDKFTTCDPKVWNEMKQLLSGRNKTWERKYICINILVRLNNSDVRWCGPKPFSTTWR